MYNYQYLAVFHVRINISDFITLFISNLFFKPFIHLFQKPMFMYVAVFKESWHLNALKAYVSKWSDILLRHKFWSIHYSILKFCQLLCQLFCQLLRSASYFETLKIIKGLRFHDICHFLLSPFLSWLQIAYIQIYMHIFFNYKASIFTSSKKQMKKKKKDKNVSMQACPSTYECTSKPTLQAYKHGKILNT